MQENLVFDKYTGDLTRYVGLGDVDLSYRTFQEVPFLFCHQRFDCISNDVHILESSCYIRVDM